MHDLIVEGELASTANQVGKRANMASDDRWGRPSSPNRRHSQGDKELVNMLSRHWRGGGPKRERIEIAINLLRAELTGTTFAELTGTDFDLACDRVQVPGRRSEGRTRIKRDFTRKIAAMLSGSDQAHVIMRKSFLPGLSDREIASLTSAWLSEKMMVDAEKASLPLPQPIATYASLLLESPQSQTSAVELQPRVHQDREQAARLIHVGASLRDQLEEALNKMPLERGVLRTSCQDLINAIDRFEDKARAMPPPAIGDFYTDDTLMINFLNSSPYE